VPLNRINRRYPVVAWATDRPGGFADAHIALLDQIVPRLRGCGRACHARTARGLFRSISTAMSVSVFWMGRSSVVISATSRGHHGHGLA
jgi:hypothetical protein